eukprot:SAG31_NODE_1893_length_6973_cov_5.870963_6_plen_104_part_00
MCNQSEPWSWHANGIVALQTLASVDGNHCTTVGWDFNDNTQPFFVGHTHCCKPNESDNDIVQRATAMAPPSGQSLEMRVFVDGGMIEAFSLVGCGNHGASLPI